MIFVYRFDSPREGYLLRLKGLKKESCYRLTDAVSDETIGVFTGRELMYHGLYIPLNGRSFQARMIDYEMI